MAPLFVRSRLLWCVFFVALAACNSSTAPKPGPGATALVFSAQPTTANPGASLGTVQVTAQDANGNTATGFTGTVTLAIGTNPGGSVLSGATTVPAYAGVATFTSLSLNEAGASYTLTASSAGLTGSTSDPFDILGSHPELGAVFAQPSLGGQPYGVAISPSGAVLVAQVFGGLVTRFDLPDTMPDASVTSGTQPVHVAIDPAGTRAFVINQAGHAVRVINLVTNTTIDSVPLTNDGFNIAVAPNGRRVYVTTSDGRVYVIRTSTNSIVDSMRVGSSANGLAFSPRGDRLYVSSRDAGTVTIFDTQTDASVGTITTGGMPQRLAVSTDGTKLFVANEAVGVNTVNLPAGTVGPNIPLDGSAYGLRLSPDGTRLYTTNPLSGKIFIVNAATNGLLSTLTVGGVPRNVAFDRTGLTAVITDGGGRVIFIH